MNTTRVLAAALLAIWCASPALAGTASDQALGADENIASQHQIYGTVVALHGTSLSLQLRTGHTIVVDASRALADHRSVLLTPTRPVIVRGTIGANGTVHALTILRSHSMPEYWPPDR